MAVRDPGTFGSAGTPRLRGPSRRDVRFRVGRVPDRSPSETASYTLYGRGDSFECVALLGALRAKRLAVAQVEPDASLVLALAARAGTDRGPCLRTPEGFLLAGLHGGLEWLDRVHLEPPLLPSHRQPLRRVTARILEDWIERGLPRSGRVGDRTLERLIDHLESSRFLLGPEPTRPDWLFAAWLETGGLRSGEAGRPVARRRSRLAAFGSDLLEVDPTLASEDALPISLLSVLRAIADERHAFLRANQTALRAGREWIAPDRGVGLPREGLEARRVCVESERRRVEVVQELERLDPQARRDVWRVLEPVGADAALRSPAALRPIDPADPRSL